MIGCLGREPLEALRIPTQPAIALSKEFIFTALSIAVMQ